MGNKYQDLLAGYTGKLSEDAGVRKKTAGCERLEAAFLIPLDRIEPDPEQPRTEADVEELYRLAGSLKAQGQLQPIRVRYDEDRDVYVIVAGERRWKAAKIAELSMVEAVVDNDTEALLEVQLTENVARENLNPLDTAKAFQRLMVSRGWNQTELAEALHVSSSLVSRSLALLKLPEEDQVKVAAGKVSKKKAVQRTVKRKTSKSKTTTIRTEAGTVTVTPKKGSSVDDVLRAALEQVELKKAA